MSKRIIITGASSGIGYAAASLLAKQGNKILVSARRTDRLEELAAKFPGQIDTIKCDVTNVDEVRAMVQKCVDAFGGVDVLINNAGMGLFDPLIDAKLEDWHAMFDVNVKGLLTCVHAGIPELRKTHGHIINLGSVASHNVFPNSGVYCATKHAVLAISESIRIELRKEVRVTTISPGAVNTEFIDQTKNEELLKSYKPNFEAGMTAELIAEQIAHAVNMPQSSNVSEIIIRPNS
ncbi:SDR family oxidoreductase [Sanyastnella coralliicola]|uniref:SDR family oxidoreductase n=1 Tax=Sanyastnella coralliicola TaxID=3069118 RepID=UPI0027B90700|nr:SDR family oxidoreductase [Longitalea sp. SCSIO 12813]